MDDAHGPDAWMDCQRLTHHCGGDRLGKLGPDDVHAKAVGGRDLGHPVSEKTVRRHEHLVARPQHACDAHLDAGHARAEEQVNFSFRSEHLAHAGHGVLVELRPFVSVVGANRPCKCLEHFVVDADRSRDHQELAVFDGSRLLMPELHARRGSRT